MVDFCFPDRESEEFVVKNVKGGDGTCDIFLMLGVHFPLGKPFAPIAPRPGRKDAHFYDDSYVSGKKEDVAGAGPGSSLSWDALGNPIQGISDHVALFSLLFGDGGMSIEQRRQLLNRKRSVLDAVRTDAKDVAGVVDAKDLQKVDEYL